MRRFDSSMNTASSSRSMAGHLARVGAALLAVTAAMFVLGEIVERSQPAHDESSEVRAEAVGEGHDESTRITIRTRGLT
jgi:hypothetical protein